ncbi:flagellar motor protein [Thiovibrio frasassiensis]|jgi:chemotaxis protein MotA|uniref:Flagellar motor protein n=1 Tax=Thiovibrio frasassiensis TaxID=2984131 RepID=A0A9X4MBW4_9BACT|nr:flagellar motor protein [Thiovibrio frasassiensis]MDG4474749.1 flagellar motor protein [Thiovibrio frasassiensis]
MDIATLIGLFMGFGAVIGGQLLEGGHIDALIQPTAALIVLGGTLGATFVSFPLQDILRAFSSAATAIFPQEEDPEELIGKLVGFASTARKNGLITLEQDAQRVKDRFLGQGLEMVVDGMDPEEVMAVLQIELTNFEERHKVSAEVFEAAGGFAPTIGIIGAVLGLIHVMNNLSDTSKLGAGIAVAFVATIYGLMTANIICIPLSTKLKKRLKEQILQREIVIEGLLAIQKGENPRMIEKRLRGFTLTSGVLIYSRGGGG